MTVVSFIADNNNNNNNAGADGAANNNNSESLWDPERLSSPTQAARHLPASKDAFASHSR